MSEELAGSTPPERTEFSPSFLRRLLNWSVGYLGSSAVSVTSASPHEVTLVEQPLESRFVDEKPKRLIGDRAYDSDPLDAELECQGIEMIPRTEGGVGNRRPRTGASCGVTRGAGRWSACSLGWGASDVWLSAMSVG